MGFDYRGAARRVGIPEDKLARLCALVRAEFPNDEMMAELHLLRVVLSIERGDTTLDAILSQHVTR